MTVACPSCGRTVTVPPDKAAVPNLKAKCRCGTVYAVTAPAPVAPVPLAATPVPVAPRPVAPRPAPAAVPARASAPAAPPAAAADAAPRAPTRPPPWPRCANHPQLRSLHVCPRCVKGYCSECVQTVQGGAICASCDGLCVPAASYGQKQDTRRDRDRSMWDDLGLIAAYPFRDALGFALLAIFCWMASFAPTGIGYAVLMVYTFHALTRVSNGDLKSFLPDIADPAQLWGPARLAFAAFVISNGPLLAVMFLVPGAMIDISAGDPPAVVHAAQPPPTEPDEEAATEEGPAAEEGAEERHGPGALPPEWAHEEPTRGGLAIALLSLTLIWKLVYTPVALTVAALSRSFASTLNPIIGISTIGSMGVVYWQSLVIYTVLAIAGWAAGYVLNPIPIAGALIRSFTDSYFSLAIACTLGLGVFKKAEALGWD